MVVNRKFWEGLPKDLRSTLESAMADATTYANGLTLAEDRNAYDKIKAAGKAALIEEVKAAVRLQRSVRGGQARSRMLREETGAGRLHGGIEHLSLAGVVHLARAARKEPHRRDEEDVELLGRSLRRVEQQAGASLTQKRPAPAGLIRGS